MAIRRYTEKYTLPGIGNEIDLYINIIVSTTDHSISHNVNLRDRRTTPPEFDRIWEKEETKICINEARAAAESTLVLLSKKDENIILHPMAPKSGWLEDYCVEPYPRPSEEKLKEELRIL